MPACAEALVLVRTTEAGRGPLRSAANLHNFSVSEQTVDLVLACVDFACVNFE